MSISDVKAGPGPIRLIVAGLGTIGSDVAVRVSGMREFELVAIVGRNRERTVARCRAVGIDVPVITSADLPGSADVVVEAVPAESFLSIAEPVLEAGKILVTVSSAALLDHLELVDLAARSGGRILLATGALLGLDAVRAASLGHIERVRMVTTKPPAAFEDVPYVRDLGIPLDQLAEPVCLFKGSARDGSAHFPSNLNVAASLALAGVGPDDTELEIWADPAANRNIHRIEVDADSASFELQIKNVPTDSNPKTGRLTALSVVDTLLGLVQPLRVGS